jgi:hypothetical protein
VAEEMPAAETRTSVAGGGVNGVLPIGCTGPIGDVKPIGHRKRVMQEIKDTAIFRGPAKCHSDCSLRKTTRTAGCLFGLAARQGPRIFVGLLMAHPG